MDSSDNDNLRHNDHNDARALEAHRPAPYHSLFQYYRLSHIHPFRLYVGRSDTIRCHDFRLGFPDRNRDYRSRYSYAHMEYEYQTGGCFQSFHLIEPGTLFGHDYRTRTASQTHHGRGNSRSSSDSGRCYILNLSAEAAYHRTKTSHSLKHEDTVYRDAFVFFSVSINIFCNVSPLMFPIFSLCSPAPPQLQARPLLSPVSSTRRWPEWALRYYATRLRPRSVKLREVRSVP